MEAMDTLVVVMRVSNGGRGTASNQLFAFNLSPGQGAYGLTVAVLLEAVKVEKILNTVFVVEGDEEFF